MKTKTDIDPKKAMRTAIITQAFGVLGMNSFENGVILLYLTMLGLSPARVLVYLSLPVGLSIILRLPVANLADNWGKKRVGFIGLILTVIGFAFLPAGGFLPLEQAETLIIVGLVIFATGKMLFASSWMALQSGFIPQDMRGRYFGKARMVFAISGIVFAGIVALWLGKDSPKSHFLIVMCFLTFCFVVRCVFYLKVPDVTPEAKEKSKLGEALGQIIKRGDFTSFCSYIFLLTLFSGGCGKIFSLLEKKVMLLGDNEVIMLTILTTFGGLGGFFIGGKFIDKYGTKYAFMFAHISLSICIFCFVIRDVFPWPAIWGISIVHLAMGVIAAILGLAMSTEMLALIPKENKSLATSVCMTFWLGGSALSGIISAWALDIGLLNNSWQLFGNPMTAYDSILLLFGTMVLLLVVTLSLVPSVLRKASWGPIPQ